MTITDPATTPTDDQPTDTSHEAVMAALRDFTAVGERLLAEARQLAAEVIGRVGERRRFDIVTIAELGEGDRIQFMPSDDGDPPAPWCELVEMEGPPGWQNCDVRLVLEVPHLGRFTTGVRWGDAVRRGVRG